MIENKKILEFCLEKGFLVDQSVLSFLNKIDDLQVIQLIIEKIKKTTKSKLITKKIFEEDKGDINQFLNLLPKEKQEKLKKQKEELGLTANTTKEIPVEKKNHKQLESVKILSMLSTSSQKLNVTNFIQYFKSRFIQLRKILQENPSLTNLISIGKIFGNRQGFSLIGMISSKRITKNKNLLLEIEDLTGKIKVIINQNKEELYKEAENISLDSVIGFKGSGNKEVMFANEIFFPDAFIPKRKKSPKEEYALFIGDLHFGSKLFLKNSFLKFIDYLNGKVPNTPEVDKIKYLFIVGDLITGIGNYPRQEKDLLIHDLEEQFLGVAELLGKIRKDINIIISPGNHDGVRLMEPQPIFDEKYAWPLYNLRNLIFVTNPSMVNIGKFENFEGLKVLMYHGTSFPYYANNVPKLVKQKAMNKPEKIMKYLLKLRHLAPTQGSVQYFPQEKDNLVIDPVPDIFLSGHTHKSGVAYYNNILLISVSCWEAMTPYQEKFGNLPDHCKVPMLNLKTRQLKILDFEDKNENK